MAAEASKGALDTRELAKLLEARCALALDRHQQDIQHTEAQLSSALKELELIRHHEERVLEQRVAELHREHASRMASLERRFLSDAEALQTQLQDGIHRQTLLCQAGIEERAQELLSTLGTSFAASSAASPCAAACGSPALSSSSPASPARPHSKLEDRTAATAMHPPPPAVAAATEAIAALRLQLPPSPGKLRLQVPHQRAEHSSAASPHSAAPPAGSTKPGPPAGSTCPPPPHKPSPPFLPPPAAADARATVPSTSAMEPQLATGPASSRAGKNSAGAAGVDCFDAQGRAGSRRVRLAAVAPGRSSSCEAECGGGKGGGWMDSDDSDTGGLAAPSRAPAVKTVNPGGMSPRSVRHSRPGTPVHLNMTGSAGQMVQGAPPASPRLRSYSSCTCRDGAAASPLSNALRAASGSRQWFTDDSD